MSLRGISGEQSITDMANAHLDSMQMLVKAMQHLSIRSTSPERSVSDMAHVASASMEHTGSTSTKRSDNSAQELASKDAYDKPTSEY